MKHVKRLLLVLVAGFLSACVVWEPVRYSPEAAVPVEAAVAAFQQQPELEPLFSGAVAYAVFPGSLRAGTGFGGAYGTGWLFEDSAVTGKVQMVEFFAGVDFGAQMYRSILFFRTDKSLRNFKKGSFEFTGQANAAHVVGGKTATPSYHPPHGQHWPARKPR